MHISEGVLAAPVLAGGWVFAATGTAIGLKKLDLDHIITTALLAAAFFVASLVHLPLGPGSVHLILNGLLGLILGWACVPAILVALLLQALLFGYGGLTVLGVNTTIMAGPALVVALLFGPWIRRSGRTASLAAFGGGALAVFLAALLAAAALALSDRSFIMAARLLLLAHVPVMLIEGLVTMFTLAFLRRVQPEILNLEKP